MGSFENLTFQELGTSNFDKSKLETEIEILKRKLERYEPSF